MILKLLNYYMSCFTTKNKIILLIAVTAIFTIMITAALADENYFLNAKSPDLGMAHIPDIQILKQTFVEIVAELYN